MAKQHYGPDPAGQLHNIGGPNSPGFFENADPWAALRPESPNYVGDVQAYYLSHPGDGWEPSRDTWDWTEEQWAEQSRLDSEADTSYDIQYDSKGNAFLSGNRFKGKNIPVKTVDGRKFVSTWNGPNFSGDVYQQQQYATQGDWSGSMYPSEDRSAWTTTQWLDWWGANSAATPAQGQEQPKIFQKALGLTRRTRPGY